MPIFEDIKIITLFVLAFFSVFLFSYKKGNLRSNYMLASIYCFQALESLNSAFYRFPDFWMNEFPWVFYTTEFSFFLWGPAMFFFFKFSIRPQAVFKKRDWWHVAPAVIHTLFLVFKYHIYSNGVKTTMLQNGVMSPEEDFVIHFLRNSSVIIYLLISTALVYRSKTKANARPSWLVFFLVIFYIVEFIQIMHFIDLETRIYNAIIYNTTSILWFLVAITTLYKALKNPFFFSESNIPHAKNTHREKLIENEKEFEEILKKIIQVVITEEKFIEPELTLQKIADHIDVSIKKTSYVINEHFRQNVSDFINYYKIERAKELLASPAEARKTVIEIAYEVGFNSKATFNRAFAKFSDLSPTEFRKTTTK